MASEKPITINAFMGLNTLHTRQAGQLSGGKNCVVSAGSLKTRYGCSAVAGGETVLPDGVTFAAIKSIHSAVQSGAERLLIEEGTNLWHRPTATGAWELLIGAGKAITALTAGTTLSSCRWDDFLILVNGTQMLAYDITNGTIAALGGTPPAMEYVAEHNHILFGWAPNKAGANKVYFCGYVEGTVRRSKDAWDVDEYMIDVGGNSGNPVLAYIPYSTHYLALTKNDFWRIYGSTEADFSNLYGGPTSLVNSRCAVKVKDHIMWLGQDGRTYRVFAYTGTTPVPISMPVEDLFSDYVFADPWVYGGTNEFMLFLPDATNSKTVVLVFDVLERQWQTPHEYPGVFNDAAEFGSYLQRRYVNIGLADGTLARLDDSETDFGADIESEFSIGPVDIDGRKLVIKNIWFKADPKNDFDIDVYSIADDKDEKGPQPLSFSDGAVVDAKVRFGTFRGQNLSLRCTSTDRIDELQKITIVVEPKAVK